MYIRLVSYFDRLARNVVAYMGESKARLLSSQVFGRSLHSPVVEDERRRLLQSRVNLISIMFAMLTLLWVPLDVNAFEPDIWYKLFFARVLAALAFVSLAHVTRARAKGHTGYLKLLIMFLTPIVFYGYCQGVLSAGGEYSGWAEMFFVTYTLIPFVVFSGFALLPLTAVEVISLAIPTMAALTGAEVLLQHDFDLYRHLAEMWLMFLILGACSLSGILQLQLLISLVGRNASDALTSAYTRRDGEKVMKILFEKAVSNDQTFGVAFIDLDNLKTINNVYGYEAGDQALKTASNIIIERMRDSDILIRWGGEEFIIVAPGATPNAMQNLIHRVVEGSLGNRPDGLPVTASSGLCERLEDQCKTYEDLIRLADQRMCKAQQAGGNTFFGFEQKEPAVIKQAI